MRFHFLAIALFLANGSGHGAEANKLKALNPDISANFLGLIQGGSNLSELRTEAPRSGFSLQEAEVQMTADVDPYFRAVSLFSVSQQDKSTDYRIDPEEVYVETISLPRVTLRAGKFKMAVGKHNQLHTHAYPFIDSPVIHQALLGAEGLNEVGASAALLLPVDWYSELVVQAMDLSNDVLYKSKSTRNIGAVARFKNLWDLSDSLTVEAGLSGTAGKNQFDRTSSVLGADLTFKWRPSVGGKYRALVWSTEYLDGHREGLTDASGAAIGTLGGVATWLQFQFAERWWVQGRFEYVGLPRTDTIPTQCKQSALIGFFPSEFSGFRIQYDHIATQGKASDDHMVAFQYNLSIGAHPAHTY